MMSFVGSRVWSETPGANGYVKSPNFPKLQRIGLGNREGTATIATSGRKF
jgi:hypothetical protein